MNEASERLRLFGSLKDLPRNDRQRIGQDLEKVRYAAGDEIFADQSAGEDMFFILEGQVLLSKRGQVLLTRGPGEFIGEMALIDDTPRSTAAVAESDALLLRWKRSSFRECLEENGRIAYSILRALSTKMRQEIEKTTLFKQDLERAVQIQRALLPKTSLQGSTAKVAISCQQADGVGGDYYDYVDFDCGETALLIADAQGHGFAAALLVAMLKTRFSSTIIHQRAPAEVVRALNQTISDDIQTEVRTATCFLLLLDGPRRLFRYCGAGHPTQYHLRPSSGCLTRLISQNLLLGFTGQQDRFSESTAIEWKAGDLLLLCTDGVVEMKNEAKQEFGHHRLTEFIVNHGHLDIEEITKHLQEQLDLFRGNRAIADDVTYLVVRLL